MNGWMDGQWVDGQMDGWEKKERRWMDNGQMDRWEKKKEDGWMDKRKKERQNEREKEKGGCVDASQTMALQAAYPRSLTFVVHFASMLNMKG